MNKSNKEADAIFAMIAMEEAGDLKRDEIAIARQKHSRVSRMDHPSFPFPIAAKRIRDDPGLATLQFESLKRISRALGADEQCRVPHPIGVDETSGTLLMEWVDLPSLESRILDWRTSAACVLSLVAGAGQWLRRLHDAHALPDGRLETERLLEDLAKALRASPGLYGDGTLCGFFKTLHKTACAVRKISVHRGLLHGDYKPANVLSGATSTVGIDCHAISEGLVIVDLGQFLNHLDFTLLTPRGSLRLASRKRLASHFLRGYAGSKVTIERAVPHLPLTWLRLHALSRFWVLEAQTGSPFLRARYRRWCYRYVGQTVQQELSALAR